MEGQEIGWDLLEKRLKEAIVQIHIFVGDIIHDKKGKFSESRGRGDHQDFFFIKNDIRYAGHICFCIINMIHV